MCAPPCAPARPRQVPRRVLLLLLLLLAFLPLASATANKTTTTTTNSSNTNDIAVKSLNITDARRAQHQRQQQQLTVSALLQATGDVRLAPALLAAAALATGLGMTAAGYRLFRASVFACAFVVGGLAAARAVEGVFRNESYLVAASWTAFVGAGLLAGCVIASIHYAGIFAVGAAGGVLLAVALSAGVGNEISPSDPDTVLLVLVIILGIVGGVAAVRLEKPVLITVTSFVGAALAMWGIGYFAGDFPSGDALRSFRDERRDGGASWFAAVPGAWWGYFAALVALTAAGVLVQRKVTARNGYYDVQGGEFVKDSDKAATRSHRRAAAASGSGSRVRALASRFQRSAVAFSSRIPGASAYGHAQTPSPTTRAQRARRPRSTNSRRQYESGFMV